MTGQYVLAQHGTAATELVQGEFTNAKVGDVFDRMPGIHREQWRIVKIFKGSQAQKLCGLVDLIGFDEASALFSYRL